MNVQSRTDVISWEDVLSAVVELAEAEARSNWELGDVVNVARQMKPFGAVSSLARETTFSKARLQQAARVAEAYTPAQRQEIGLSWSLFREVAHLPDRMEILAKAVDLNWTHGQLRASVLGTPMDQWTHACPLCGKPHKMTHHGAESPS